METNFTTELLRQGAHTALVKSRKAITGFPTNRCSMLGDVCERRLFYWRTEWDKATSDKDSMLGIFATGNILEPVAEDNLKKIGNETEPKFRIIGKQMPTKDNLFEKYNISGTIDGILQIQNANNDWENWGVVDIKTSNPNIFAQIKDINSIKKYGYMRSYIPQLTLYSLAHNLNNCALIFINKANLWDFKVISWQLDYQLAESLLQKADRINKAVADKKPPPKINSQTECANCPFFHICMPDLIADKDKIKIINNDDDLYGLLARREQLSPAHTEYEEVCEELDHYLKQNFTLGQNIICAEYCIEWKQVEVNYKAKEAYTQTQWRKTITKLKEE